MKTEPCQRSTGGATRFATGGKAWSMLASMSLWLFLLGACGGESSTPGSDPAPPADTRTWCVAWTAAALTTAAGVGKSRNPAPPRCPTRISPTPTMAGRWANLAQCCAQRTEVRSWARQHFGTSGWLTNVSFSDDARSGWVLGSDGSWFTQDGGASWSRKAPLLDYQLGFRRLWTASDGRLVVAPDSNAGFHASGTFTTSPSLTIALCPCGWPQSHSRCRACPPGTAWSSMPSARPKEVWSQHRRRTELDGAKQPAARAMAASLGRAGQWPE